MNLTCHIIQEEELDSIHSFHVSQEGEKRARYAWEWEYGKLKPLKSILLAIKDSDRVIATQGMITVKVAIGDEVFLTGKNESLLVDREYRGKGISTILYKYSIEEYAKTGIWCLWGFSSKAIIPLRKAGFRVFEDIMGRMILSLDYRKARELAPAKPGVKGLMLKLAVTLGTFYSKTFFGIRSRSKLKLPEGFELLPDLKEPSDILSMFGQIRKKFPGLVYIHQDEDFVRWRIKQAPNKMITRFLYKNKTLVGYYYLTAGRKFSEITDFTFMNDEAAELLADNLEADISLYELKFLYYTGNSRNALNKSVMKLFASRGFLRVKGPSHFVLRNYRFENNDKLFSIDDWYLSELWSEGN